MHWEAWVTLATVVLVLYALARNLGGPDVILMGGAVVLSALHPLSNRFPSPAQVASTFGNEGVLTVGALFMAAAALTETGAMTLITDRLLRRPQTTSSAQIRLMTPVVCISAFLNNTPVVAIFIPVVAEWCKKTRLSASKLYLPLSYAAIL